MASPLKVFQDREAAIHKSMSDLLDVAKGENRSLNEEEKADFDAYEKEIVEVKASIRRANTVLENEKSLRTVPAPAAETPEQIAERNGKPKGDVRIEPVVRYGKLKHFHGEGAEQRAYRAGHWFRAAIFGSETSQRWCQDNGIQLRAQGSASNSAGGYLVPEELAQTIIDLREEYGIFRRNARVRPMGSETLLVPRRASGVTAYFVGENTAITDSTKGWDVVELTARKLAAMVFYPWELADDAIIDLADDLAFEIAWAFAKKEDECGFIGDGTSTYGGIAGVVPKIGIASGATYAGSIATAITGNTAFSTLDLADFHTVTGKLPLYARTNAKWYISGPGYGDSMERLLYAAGGNNTTTVSGRPTLSFLGYPVELVQVMNSTLTAQPSTILLFFGDLRLAASLGDRRGFEVATSRDYLFNKQQIAIQGWERFDINVHDLGDATNAGPVIALKTPSS